MAQRPAGNAQPIRKDHAMNKLTPSAEIEAALERDRASLTMELDDLRDRIERRQLTGQAMDTVLGNWEGSLRALTHAVKVNPVALAMMVGGLAWLALGSRRGNDGQQPTYRAISRWEGEGGSVELPRTTAEASENAEWLCLMDGLREEARDRIAALVDGSSVGRRDLGAEQAAIMADLAKGMTEAFLHGLEALSPEARDRIVAARKQAYVGYRKDRRDRPAHGRGKSSIVREHPLLASVVVLAAGAAIAAVVRRDRPRA
jgi:hypothetical protein